MVQSLNTKVDFTIEATSYLGIASYGKVMVGDKAFEFYNEKNIRDYIQIPWEEVDYIMASVMFKGKGFLALQLRLKIMEDLRFQHVIIRRYYVQ